jgi:transcriptional regulator with XRE-family HTH domain
MKDETIMVDLIERRKEKGYTQQKLADELGVSLSTFKKWEHRRGDISKNHLLDYSRILNMNPMTIIDPSHEFMHYNDKKYNFDGKPNMNSLLSICFKISARQAK